MKFYRSWDMGGHYLLISKPSGIFWYHEKTSNINTNSIVYSFIKGHMIYDNRKK